MLAKIIYKLKGSKDNKVLVQNFAYLSLLQVAGYVFPLITMPYLARVIGVDGFGNIAFASAVMIWVQTIADWGFNFTATRDVAQNRENSPPDEIRKTRRASCCPPPFGIKNSPLGGLSMQMCIK